VFASTSLGEKGVEGVITAADGFVTGHLPVGLNPVLKAEKFPAGVSGLDTGLTYCFDKLYVYYHIIYIKEKERERKERREEEG